jgi:hypothetical protein
MNQRGAYAPMGTIATSIPRISGADLDEERAVGAVVGVIDPRTTCHGEDKAAPRGRAVVE